MTSSRTSGSCAITKWTPRTACACCSSDSPSCAAVSPWPCTNRSPSASSCATTSPASTATSSTPYLTHRLRLAGCEIPLFEPPAIEALFQSARGLPRLVNRIAHYALTAAAVNDARTVNAGHLEHAVAELRL